MSLDNKLKVLILGSEGFIGNCLVRNFLKEKFVVYGCDLFEAPRTFDYDYIKVSRLSPEWDEIFNNSQFDACINAAGSGNVPYSMQHPLYDFEANALDTIRILDAIRKYNKNCRYLHISSAAVYGNPENLPVKESAQKKPLSPYGWHKLIAEHVCNEYNSIYGLQTAIIRPFSVYGEGLRKQLLWDVCIKLKKTDSIMLFGTGRESRDFIHYNDLARLMLLLLIKGKFEGEVYNAATGIETQIQHIAALFEQYFDKKKRISFSGETRAGDPMNWRADISTVMSLGFTPSILIADGINDYIRWFEATQVGPV